MEPVNKLTLVSIIIVNWNGEKVFADCLKSLKKIKYSNWELIIVDNGSTDGSEKLFHKIKLPYQKIILIKNRFNKGFAEANNQGYKKSNGKYILLLNNDTRVTPNFLNILVDKMEKDNNLGVIQPKIFLMDTDHLLDNAGSFLTKIGFLKHWGFMEKDRAEFRTEREIFSAKGACMLIRKSIIDKIDLFDKDFVSYFEESDFCWRVWMAGYKILFYPKAVIYHKLGFTIRRLNATNLNYHYYKNRIRSLIKNLEFSNLVFVLIPHLIISLCLVIVFLLRFNVKNSFMIVRALAWNVQNLPSTLRLRKVIQKERKVDDDVLFKNLSQKIDWFKYWHDLKRIEKDSVRSNLK